MKTLLYFLLCLPLFFSTKSLAKGGKGNLLIQPIIGLETVKKWTPTVRTVTRTVVGARAIYGPPLLSAEAEVTRAQDDEYLYEQDMKIEEESYAAKLGVRTSIGIPFVRFFIRGGGQARQRKIKETQAGVVTNNEPAIRTSPYAGAGLSINLMGIFVNAGYTAIFTGKPKGSDYEHQTTLGIGMRF
jgi:hypothetical protein